MNLFKILFLGAFFLFNQPGEIQEKEFTQESTVIDTIPFVLTSHNNISIQAILNKKDTVALMFHTAAGSVSLIEEATKRLTSINWGEAESVKSWGGESTSRGSGSNSLKIGTTEWENVTFWECKNSGPFTDGKFGANMFQEKIIELNFDKSQLILHKSLPNKIDNFEKLDLKYEGGRMFIEGLSLIGEQAFSNKYLIHSGYAGTLLYDDKFVASSKIGGQLETLDEKELKDSYGNTVKVKKAKLPTFKIGKEELINMPVGFFEGSIGRQNMSVLGGDIIKRFNIIIDADRTHIYLCPNSLKNLPYSQV